MWLCISVLPNLKFHRFAIICFHLYIYQEELKKYYERADNTDHDVQYVEYQLKTVGENMKLIEISEEKSLEREENYLEHIYVLSNKLKIAENQQEYGEKNISKVNHRMDEVEDDIVRQKENIQNIANELNEVLNGILKY